jgi:hypothetical protein
MHWWCTEVVRNESYYSDKLQLKICIYKSYVAIFNGPCLKVTLQSTSQIVID